MNTRKTSICFVAAIFSAAISVSCSDDAAEEAGRGTVEPTDSAVTGTGEYVDPLFADGTYECYPVGTTWRNRSGALQYCYTYEVTKDTDWTAFKNKWVAIMWKHSILIPCRSLSCEIGSIRGAISRHWQTAIPIPCQPTELFSSVKTTG